MYIYLSDSGSSERRGGRWGWGWRLTEYHLNIVGWKFPSLAPRTNHHSPEGYNICIFALLFRCQKESFLQCGKKANIVPILKSSNRSHPSDYRPVSVLCIVSKLLEKLVHLLLWEHLLEHAPISDCQWGFQRGKSTTTTTLLSTTHEWCTLLDQQKSIMCIFFDFN